MLTKIVSNKIKGLMVLGLCVLCSLGIKAQLTGYTRSIIPTLSLLPVNTVNCFYQDSEGYMWYGTVDGLCRDDGYSIHTFRNNFLTPELIQINLIQGITEDSRHRIWFCTHKGMYILDKTNYAITPIEIPELKEAHINTILSSNDGCIYAYSGSKLYKVDMEGKLVDKFQLAGNITGIYEDSSHRLWVCTSPAGIFMKEEGSNKFKTINNDLNAMSIREDFSHKFLWLTCYDKRIYKIYLGNNITLVPQTIVGDDTNINYFEFEQDDANHYLWVHTNIGIRVIKAEADNKVVNVPTIGLLPQLNMLLTSVYKDRDGNIWVGGFDTQSFYVHYQQNSVINYVGPVLQAQTNYAPAIVTLCRDNDGYIWYYQEGNGLYFYNPATQQATSYRTCPATAAAPLRQVPYLIRSKYHNCIWASTLRGAYLVKREGETMVLKQSIDLSQHTAKTGNVECIYEDAKGNLWISTMNGLYVWKVATRRIKVLSEDIGDISDFVQTTDGMVWGTIRNRGICRIDEQDNIKIYPHEIDFTTLDAESNGHLWLGTGEGQVLEFNPAKPDSLKDWTIKCDMTGNMVDHIAIDNIGHVWITTNQRIREFNPKNGAFRMLNTGDENVPLNRFLPRAVYFDKPTATLYFGGIPGFISLKPSKALDRTPRKIDVKISDVCIGDKSIWLTPERHTDSNSIDIDPDETNISISFSTLDYINRKHINFAYRLKGVDKEWIYLTEGKNVANYNKLSKGEYTLEVKASDENGLWSNNITTFTIHRLPAWYETWYAYTLYILLLASIVYVLGRLYFNWHKEKQEREMIENLLKARQMQIEDDRRNAEKKDSIPAEETGVQQTLDIPVSQVRSFDEEFLAKATHIVEQNLANPELNVVFLASELGMSRSTFMRKIKAVTGQTPLDYIKSIKLKHAYAMLQDKTATIQDVMRAVGYNDRKTFTQSFKDAFDITPNEHQHNN